MQLFITLKLLARAKGKLKLALDSSKKPLFKTL